VEQPLDQDHETMDDETRLLRQMARRDRAAWAVMYDRHVGDVFGLVYHLVGRDRGTAEDVCQEVWLLAIERFDGFDARRGGFRNWLIGIARHRVRHHLRRHAVGEADLDSADSTGAFSPLDALELGERADVVRAALLCLDRDHRRVLIDKYADGLSVSEIADRSGRSAKAVEALLSRARARLRELLQHYFSSPTGDERHEPIKARPI
jgi:RNA polymerase sigma-70 factor, ECF subfamily